MTEKTVLARNIEALAKQKGLSLRALARITGLSSSAISSIVNRGAIPRAKNVRLIADALGVSVDDLYNAELKVRTPKESEIKGFPVPLFTLDALGEMTRNAEADVKPAGWMPEVPFSDCADDSVLTVYAEGSALDPSICAGDLLYVNTGTQAKEGDYVVALAKDVARPVVRIFIKGDTGDDWLVSDNPHYPGEEKLRLEKIIGVIVARASRVR